MSHRDPVRPLSPEARRGERRAEMCKLVNDARLTAGLTTEALASDVGCTRGAIVKMLDVEDIGHPVHADVLTAPLIAKECVRLLADRAGMIAIELPRAGESFALDALVEIQRETAEAVTTALESFADGVVTRAENARTREQIRDAIEALARLDRALESAAHEPAVNVRSIGEARR